MICFMKPNSHFPKLTHRRTQGFTLVEMLLVLVILAVLAAIVIPKFSGRSQQAKVTAAHSQISSIELALDAFEVDTGYYPTGMRDSTRSSTSRAVPKTGRVLI